MPGRVGIDYFVGDHEQMAIDDCRKRAEEYARAVLAAGRQTNPNLKLPNSVAEIRRYYGTSW